MVDPKPHIFVIDDEAAMRNLLKDFLESQGYRVTSYSSGHSLLKSLREGSNVNAIIADVRMAPMTGIELLQIVKRDSPLLPVVLFTAAGSTDERNLLLKAGAAEYFLKPFPLSRLKASLEQLLAAPPFGTPPNKTP